jgi:hypothetical protein
MSKTKRQARDGEIFDSPTYWFVVMEAAKRKHDFATAAEAQRELSRLGVKVIYRRQRERGRGQ